MESSRVEILMATYNGEKYVAEQIASIQAQTYEDWSLLISDDCSTDGTLDIISSIAENDDRIRIVSSDVRFGGPIPNFLNLIGYSSGPYVMFCDQDDVWNPNKVEVSLGAIQEIECCYGEMTPALVSTDVEVVDQDLNTVKQSMLTSERLSTEAFLPHSLAENNVIGCTMIANRALVSLASRQVSSEDIMMHDWWLSLIAESCGHSSIVNQTTMKYRQHGDNAVGAGGISLLTMLRNFKIERTCANWKRTENQARELIDCFASDMSDSAQSIVSHYIEWQEQKTLLNLFRLLKSGYRSHSPVRIASQIIVYLYQCIKPR